MIVPCARGGCTNPTLTKYCSRRCAAIARLCAGWTPQVSILRPEVRQKACRRGALACAAAMRRRRAKAVLERLRALLEHRALQDLDAEQRGAVSALIGKGYRLGKADGYQRGYRAQSSNRWQHGQQGEIAHGDVRSVDVSVSADR